MKNTRYTIIFDLFGVTFSKGFESSRKQLVKLFNKNEHEINKAYVYWERLFDLGIINEDKFWYNINSELNTNVKPTLLTKIIIDNYRISPNTIELIKYVSKHNHVIVYSNFRKVWFDILDKKYKLTKIVDDVFISSETKILKPDEAVFTFLRDKYNKPINHFILIDDNEENVKAANKVGARGIKFKNVFEVEPVLRKEIPTNLQNYDELYSGIFIKSSSGKFIFQQRENISSIANPGKVSVFGGRAKNRETPKMCAIREIKEELNMSIKKDDLIFLKEVSCPIENNKWMKCFYFLLDDVHLSDIELMEGEAIIIETKKNVPLIPNLTKIVEIVFKSCFSDEEDISQFNY